jgi:hypothetical protein
MALNKTVRQMVAAVLVLGTLGAGPSAAFAQLSPRVSRVLASDTDTWRIWVTAGYTYTVIVDGDGDTDLDLFVRDRFGLVGRDIDATDYCVVTFRARTTGYIEIAIENLGRVYNEYVISVQ